MKNKIDFGAINFTSYIVISFYVFGGAIVNSMVGYRTWSAVGPDEFPAFHKIDGEQIVPFFVVFFFFSFIPQILLFWFRPLVISTWMVWTALSLNLIALISTITIQIPIQVELSKQLSLELLDKLIRTDFLFRRIPALGLAIVNAAMLYRVVAQHDVPVGR